MDGVEPYTETVFFIPCGISYGEYTGLQFYFQPPVWYAPNKSLYNFWEPVIELLENSYLKFSCSFNLPPHVLQKLELFEKIRIFNREDVIESWEEEHTMTGIKLGEFILRSVTPYDEV